LPTEPFVTACALAAVAFAAAWAGFARRFSQAS
jgi:hypothetical protein